MAEKIGVYIDTASLPPCAAAASVAGLVREHFARDCPVVRTLSQVTGGPARAVIEADLAAGTIDAVLVCGPSPRLDDVPVAFGPDVPVGRVNLRPFAALAAHYATSAPVGEPLPPALGALLRDTVAMEVVRLRKTEPLRPETGTTCQTILVLGGGWAGLHAALAAAQAGHAVIVVEKTAHLGGKALAMRRCFSLAPFGQDAVSSGLERLVAAINAQPAMTIHYETTLAALAGAPGQYVATLVGKDGREETVPVGAVVLAAGYRPLAGDWLAPFGYGRFPNVLIAPEFEHMVHDGPLVRPSDGKTPATVAFVADVAGLVAAGRARTPVAPQTNGEEGNPAPFTPIQTIDHLAYASELASMVALKHAGYVRELAPEAAAVIVADSMVFPGLQERAYRAAQDDPGIMLTRATVTDVREEGDGNLVIALKDSLLGADVALEADLVVLSTGVIPTTAFDPTLNLLYRQGPGLPDLDRFGGYADSNFICFPYETRRTGIYAAGCVRQPMTMRQAADDGEGAALKAIQSIVSAGRGVAVHPRSGDRSLPVFNLVRCTQCKRCIEECPFGALDDDGQGTPVPNPSRCRRCGICMGACPERVISFADSSVDMIGSMIRECRPPAESPSGEPRVLVLACENDAVPALDMAAWRGRALSPYVRVIGVRCLGSVNVIWIADAVSQGFDGVMLLGCATGDDYQCHFIKGSQLCSSRLENFAETLTRMGVEPERVVQFEVAIDGYDVVPAMIDRFVETVRRLGPNPFRGL